MPFATFKKRWKYAERGVNVHQYEAEVEYEVDDRCVEIAKDEDNLESVSDTPAAEEGTEGKKDGDTPTKPKSDKAKT